MTNTKDEMTAQEIIDAATDKAKVMAVCKKISTQRPSGNYSNLVFAVFSQAVHDALGGVHSKAAQYDLRRSKFWALEILGIDTGWAKKLFIQAGVPIMGERK